MATSILLKFLTLECDIPRTIWQWIHFFFIFHVLSFQLNLFFDRTCPLSTIIPIKCNQFRIFDVAITEQSSSTEIYRNLAPNSAYLQSFLNKSVDNKFNRVKVFTVAEYIIFGKIICGIYLPYLIHAFPPPPPLVIHC